MTEEYTPPYTSTPLATGAETVPPVGGTPPVVGYSTPPATGATESGTSTTDVAKDQASQVTQGAVQAGQHVAGVAKEQAANVGAEASRQARDLLSQASSEISQQASSQQQRLAQSIRSLGDELHKMTQPGEQASGPAADLARQGAQRTREFASWLEQREPGEVLDEVKSFARRRPGTFLLLAAGAGLLAGRMTRGLKEAAGDQPEGGDRLYSTEYGSPTQYGSGVQYGDTTQYAGAQYGEPESAVVLGTVEEIEVVRPYASSEDGPTGYPTTGGGTTGGTTTGGTL
jgi:gas vesicle protein